MDPDYCLCGATVRLDEPSGTMSIYIPPTSPKHGHRHEWQKERTTAARHAKVERFTLHEQMPLDIPMAPVVGNAWVDERGTFVCVKAD